MKLTSDWHIHSRNSCDDACMKVAELVKQAAAKGIVDYGLTDHIHSAFNLPDLVKSRAEYLACKPAPNFHFGVEASCMSAWELEEIATGLHPDPVYGLRAGGPAGAAPALGLRQQDIADLQIEFVLAGTHWPLYVPLEREAIIRDYHRQNMFLVTHPLVDIVAHPWWWMGHWQDADKQYRREPWFDDFQKIPASMHEEFADAALAHDKVVEINISAMLLNPEYPPRFRRQYVEYLADLKEKGVKLSIGSDCHGAHYEIQFEKAAALLAGVGFRDTDFWRLPPRAA